MAWSKSDAFIASIIANMRLIGSRESAFSNTSFDSFGSVELVRKDEGLYRVVRSLEQVQSVSSKLEPVAIFVDPF